MHPVCIVELHVTAIYIKIFSVAQQCLCGKLKSTATIKRTYVFMYIARCCIEHTRMFVFLWPSLGVQFDYTDPNDRQVVTQYLSFCKFSRKTFYEIRWN
jgi:hypothetical protein